MEGGLEKMTRVGDAKGGMRGKEERGIPGRGASSAS